MTEEYTILFLYSKYSEACKKASMEMRGIPELAGATFICVDNKEVRDKITGVDQHLKVSYLPCIVRIYNNTNHGELFEGDKVYDLIQSYKAKDTPSPTRNKLIVKTIPSDTSSSPRESTSHGNRTTDTT